MRDVDVEELRKTLTRILLCEVFLDDTTQLSLGEIIRAFAPVQRWRRAGGPFVEQLVDQLPKHLADQLANDDDLLPSKGYEQRPLWEVLVETEIKRLRREGRVKLGPGGFWMRGTRD